MKGNKYMRYKKIAKKIVLFFCFAYITYSIIIFLQYQASTRDFKLNVQRQIDKLKISLNYYSLHLSKINTDETSMPMLLSNIQKASTILGDNSILDYGVIILVAR
jgi:hypothetical protein